MSAALAVLAWLLVLCVGLPVLTAATLGVAALLYLAGLIRRAGISELARRLAARR